MSISKAAKRAKFEQAYAAIREELIAHFKGEGMPDTASDWYRESLDYNVPGGKLNRGLSVVDTTEILKGRPLTDKEYFQAAVLGWCVELLQAFFLVSDDIMDSSVTRRSQPCWYRVEKVGMIAINDSFMLEAAIYHLLKSHFKGESYYVDLLELFHETTYQTEMGQLIDLITAPEGQVDLSKFSLKKHHLIVIYKTSYYSFYLPVALAMHLCGIPTTAQGGKSPYTIASDILLPLGEYFQIQDDFLDFSATPEVLGKIGTDIVDNKCSWCINTALAVCTPEQRTILDNNYGKKGSKDADGVWAEEKRVKEVYEAISLRNIYKKYEEDTVTNLRNQIAAVPEDGGMKRQVFTSFLDKIFLPRSERGTKMSDEQTEIQKLSWLNAGMKRLANRTSPKSDEVRLLRRTC